MKAITLLYHDVLSGSDHDQSGPAGRAAALYKLSAEAFDRQLALLKAADRTPITVADLASIPDNTPPLLLTFDDGGVTAFSEIAPRLEAFGWRGHFLITAAWIGTPGFLDAAQIRDLAARGHIIGSHSQTHPSRMASLGDAELRAEWRDSTRALAAITGQPVIAASVPGGDYSHRVAEAAAEAGIRYLFTSEPVIRTARVSDCLVLGRCVIRRRTPDAVVAALATGQVTPRLAQHLRWNLAKLPKRIGGQRFITLRRWLLRR